jgi:hypothetical protein
LERSISALRAFGRSLCGNSRYREAADNQRKALNELPPVKPGEKPNRARQSTEESLAEYERKAKAMKP